jgi:hypothetical protein
VPKPLIKATPTPTPAVVAKPIPAAPVDAQPAIAVDEAKPGSWSMDDFPSPPIPSLDADAQTTPGVALPNSEEFTSQPLAPLQEDQHVAIELDSTWQNPAPLNPELPADPAEEWQKRELSEFTVNVPLDQLSGEINVEVNPDIDADIEFKTSVHHRFGNPGTHSTSAGTAFSTRLPPPTAAKDLQGAPKLHPHAEKELKARQARDAAAAAASISKTEVAPAPQAMSPREIQKIIYGQTEALLKDMIQKIIPEMANRLIQAEIDRLLSERSPDE